MLLIAFPVFAENADANPTDSTFRKSSEQLSESFDPDAMELVDKKLLMSYLADHSKFLLIDARSRSEYEQSHIEGAVNLPLEAYRADPSRLATHKNSKIVIYCRSGKRASRLVEVLKRDGFSDVQVLPSRQIFTADNLMVFNCGVDADKK